MGQYEASAFVHAEGYYRIRPDRQHRAITGLPVAGWHRNTFVEEDALVWEGGRCSIRHGPAVR